MYHVISLASKRTKSSGYLFVFLYTGRLLTAGITPTILLLSLTTLPKPKLLWLGYATKSLMLITLPSLSLCTGNSLVTTKLHKCCTAALFFHTFSKCFNNWNDAFCISASKSHTNHWQTNTPLAKAGSNLI